MRTQAAQPPADPSTRTSPAWRLPW